MVLKMFIYKGRVNNRKHEYESLDSEYTLTQKPPTKFVLICLFLVQVVVILLWALTLIGRAQDGETLAASRKTRENFIFVEAEFSENDEDIPVWESKTHDSKCVFKTDDEKLDCHPEKGGNEDLCRSRGCCWEPVDLGSVRGVPWCYYPKHYGGYRFINKTHSKGGITSFFERTFPSPYPDDVKLMKMDLQFQTDYRVRFKMVDAENNRFEPPYPEIPVVLESVLENPIYQIMHTSRGFRLLRNGSVILSSDVRRGFIFADQFLQITFKVKGKIYGIGEHQTSLQLDSNWTTFTLFNRDGIPQSNTNLYGSHPFVFVIEPTGHCHGIFFHNSNAMDVVLQPLPAVTFRTIGGVFDFYFFLGPTPADVIRQYLEIIGTPFFPPYWSLGFHLSRLGHKNTSEIRKVWQRTRDAEIPFDTQWHDIDYMNRRNDFTYDKKNYLDLPVFVDEIHAAGMRYVPIIDPGISGCEPNNTYTPYSDGIVMNVFVKNDNGTIFVGKVWNSKCTVFPDFTATYGVRYWARQLIMYYRKIPFDGIWIDMNEPSNFLDGSFNGCPNTKWDNPPYTPNVAGGKLYSLTLCMSTRHAAGRHYDIHNLYGISEAIATNKALKLLNKRPFIISRSTYPGIGSYAGHWSGDVTSTWESMRATIPKMLTFSLFGVPMMGADICGFNGNTTALLCQRWSQLGAFYPFSRNHNSDDCIDQDPVALGEEVVQSTKKALEVRYRLLPYLYTLFFKAHTRGETVARPLFFEFVEDSNTHNFDKSFLWGCCVLIVPVLEEYATTVKTYLPAARWYDWYTGLGIESNGTYTVLKAHSDTIPVLIRGGVVLPTQAPNVTTALSRKNRIELVAAFNNTLYGSGSLYWDDGESLDVSKTKQYGYVTFSLTPKNLTSEVKFWEYHQVPIIGSIKILGFIKPVQRVFFNNVLIPFKWDTSSLIISVNVTHPIDYPFVLRWKRIGE